MKPENPHGEIAAREPISACSAPQEEGGNRLRALIMAPHLDSADVGETLVAYELVAEMSRHADLTVLAFECRKGPPLAEQLPLAETIAFVEPEWMRGDGRLNAMAKPFIFLLNRKVKRWLRAALKAGRSFDVAHQILPAAPRYGSPLAGFDIPFVLGPVGGALPTPPAFREEVGSAPWYTRLRSLDALRFRHDPVLRRSYRKAALTLGVAPYMREILAPLEMRRFEPFLGIGVDDLAPEVERHDRTDQLSLLHVGRAVRTKGLRDSIRALAELPDMPGVTLTSIGGGEEVEICREEAARLGVADRVRILGHLPRPEIEALYRESDVFIFPSFRESMGGVLYEAMRWGLPAITVDCGGPGWIVDESCGLKVNLTSPEIMPRDLAQVIRQLATDPALRRTLSKGARRKIAAEALWSVKAQHMLDLYAEIAVESRR